MSDVKWGVVAWEGDEYVVTRNGAPVGGTLGKVEAHQIARWLSSTAFAASQPSVPSPVEAARLKVVEAAQAMDAVFGATDITQYGGTPICSEAGARAKGNLRYAVAALDAAEREEKSRG